MGAQLCLRGSASHPGKCMKGRNFHQRPPPPFLFPQFLAPRKGLEGVRDPQDEGPMFVGPIRFLTGVFDLRRLRTLTSHDLSLVDGRIWVIVCESQVVPHKGNHRLRGGLQERRVFPEDCEEGFTWASSSCPPPWGPLQSDHLLLMEKTWILRLHPHPGLLSLLLFPLRPQTPVCPSPTSTTDSLPLGP